MAFFSSSVYSGINYYPFKCIERQLLRGNTTESGSEDDESKENEIQKKLKKLSNEK